MKVNKKHNIRRFLITALSLVCCLCLVMAIGCSGKGAKKSVFYQDGTTFVLESDYTLSTVDEKARRGGKNEVRFTQAISLDLQGYILDLGGRTLTVTTDQQGVVTFKNGTITGGKLNISVPNGDVDFDNVTIAESVSYELEAASETIRMNNSNLNGQCTIKSNTHVEINRSSVSDLTLSGSGYVNVNEGATLGKLEVGKNAEGAKVKVGETSKITGELNISAAADVVVGGEVASLNVTEDAASSGESKLNLTVKSTASVLTLALKAAAAVEVQGTVSSVQVDSSDASVNVAENATVFTVKMSAAGEVSVSGDVGNIIVSDDAEGAKVGLEEGANVQGIVVGANGTQITVSENANVESVKVSEDVTDATIPDTVTTETVSKDQVNEYYSAHTHLYQLQEKVDATCTSDGKEVYKCVEDGEVYERIYKALGHDYKYETIKAPTETSAGQGKYTCTRCGDSYTVVLKPEGAAIVTISGLSEVLRKVFGEGFQVDLGNVVYVQKEFERNYKDGKLESIEYTSYYLAYIKQCDLRFDFSSDEKVKGSFNLMAYGLETEDISKIDLSDLSTVEFSDEAIIHAYFDGEKVYIYASEEIADEDGNIAVSLEKLLEYLCESDEVPEAINLLANALRFIIDLDGEEVDMTSVYLIFGAVQDALTSFNPADGMNVLVKFALDNFFAKTVGENGLTTYTLDLEKVKDMLNYYGDMTLSKFIDEVLGANASKNLFEALRLVPDLTLNNAVTYLKNQLANYAIDLEATYPYVESFIYDNLGVTVSVEELLYAFGDTNVTGFVAYIYDIELDVAKEMVDGVIEGVISYMNTLTVDNAVTYIYNYVKGAAGGDEDADVDYPYYPDEDEYYDLDDEEDEEAMAETSAVKVVCGLIDYVKDCVTLQYVTGENFNKVYVDVAGYKFTLEIDEKDGFTLETAVAIAEQVMAEVSVKLNENKFGFSANVLNYGVEATADKEKGTFTVSVYAAAEDEAASDKEELAALTFACVNNELVLTLSVFGDDYIDFTAGVESGNLDLMIPTALDDYIAVNVNWETEDNVTTVYVAYDETVLRAIFNLSQKASLAISVGEFDEDDDFVATLENFFTADISVAADENGTLTGMTVEYTIDGRKSDSWNDLLPSTNWNEGIASYLSHYFYLWKHKVEISFNKKISADETNKELAKGDIEKLQKLEFEYEYYDETYRLYYVEEEVDGKADAYYVLTNVRIDNYGKIYETSWVLDVKDGLPDFAVLAYAKDCGDWYNLSMSFFGQAQVNVYNGIDDEPIDSYVRYETDSVSFYYNVKTGETTKNSQHDWTVTDVKYHSDSHKCQDGLTVTTKCSLCGKTETETNDDGCVWITKEYGTITTTCGDACIKITYCPGCNDTDFDNGFYFNTDWFYLEANHSMEYSGTLSLSEEDLKEKYPTAYHIDIDDEDSTSYICTLCNLTVERYTVYTYDATNGCHCHTLYRYLQIDHNSEETTLLYETEEDRHDVHYTEKFEYVYDGSNKGTGQKWLDEINQLTGKNYSLSNMSYIYYNCYKCPACGYLETKYYSWGGYPDTAGELAVRGYLSIDYYSDGLDYLDYDCYEQTSDVYTVISSVTGDKFDDIKKYFGSDLTALSDQSAQVYYWYRTDYGIMDVSISLANGDYIEIRNYGGWDYFDFYGWSWTDWGYWDCDDSFSWYDYSECLKTTLTFKDNGKLAVEENVIHDECWQTIHLGNNCEEDGWYEVSVCMVCGHTEGGEDDIHYYHYGWYDIDEIESRICDNLYVSYYKTTYDCCGAVVYGELEVYLTGNVVLYNDVYIYYDYDINLRLNGYTLDLNGYDFVICSFGGEGTDVNVYDTGRYVYNEETGEEDYVLGKIVDNAAEGEKGLLVICVKGGNIDVGNINIRCNSFLSDDDDNTTIEKSVYDDTGYVLTLGTCYPQI